MWVEMTAWFNSGLGDFPLCRLGTSKECHDKTLNPNSGIIREIMTDVTFEGKDRKKMKKKPTSYLWIKLKCQRTASLMEIANG